MDSKKVSILSALAATSCCLPPLLLLGLTLLGVGTAGFAGMSSSLGAIKWYILPLAITGVGLSYWLYFREKKKCESQSCKMANRTFTISTLIFSTITVSAFTLWSIIPLWANDELANPQVNPSSSHYALYEVEGMTCGGCEIAIDGALEATNLIDSVSSSSSEGKVLVWYSTSNLDLEKLDEAIQSVGYRPKLLKNK